MILDSGQNAHIDFKNMEAELYKIDLEQSAENQYTSKYLKIDNNTIKEPVMEYIISKPKNGKIKDMIYQFINIIGNMYPVSGKEIKKLLNMF